MLADFIYNPLFLIFLSYGLGVLFTELIKLTGLYYKFDNQNYLDDLWTNRIGVLHLGWLIRHSFLGMFNQKLKIRGKVSINDLNQLRSDMTYAEVNHLTAFVLLFVLNIIMLFLEVTWWYILLFFVINLIFNLYLVLLQQYNKRRIDLLLNRIEREK